MGKFLKDADGATAIEYGLIACLVGTALLGIVVLLGPHAEALAYKLVGG